MLNEFWSDYNDPVDNRSVEKKVSSEMRYLRNRVDAEKGQTIKRLGLNSQNPADGISAKAMRFFNAFSKTLEKYGY